MMKHKLNKRDLIKACEDIISDFDYDQGKAFTNLYAEAEEEDAEAWQESAAKVLAGWLPSSLLEDEIKHWAGEKDAFGDRVVRVYEL